MLRFQVPPPSSGDSDDSSHTATHAEIEVPSAPTQALRMSNSPRAVQQSTDTWIRQVIKSVQPLVQTLQSAGLWSNTELPSALPIELADKLIAVSEEWRKKARKTHRAFKKQIRRAVTQGRFQTAHDAHAEPSDSNGPAAVPVTASTAAPEAVPADTVQAAARAEQQPAEGGAATQHKKRVSHKAEIAPAEPAQDVPVVAVPVSKAPKELVSHMTGASLHMHSHSALSSCMNLSYRHCLGTC